MRETVPSLLDLADLATPMAIRVAATLRLADHAGPEGRTIEELAAATGATAPALRRLLDHLVTVGVFAVGDSGRYRPTELGAGMRDDAPEGIAPLLDIARAGGRAELAFVELLTAVTTDRTAYAARYGRDFWSDLEADPSLRRSFEGQMAWRFREHAPRIAGHDWGRFSRILDVGGGDGLLLAAILVRHPGVRGEVLDLRPTARSATARFADAGLADRAGALAGSFFDRLPSDYDAYLVSDILHDWDDERAVMILRRCRDAAAPHAAVVVVEPIRGRGTGTAIDLFMLMCFRGSERTVEELRSLGWRAGLELHSEHAVSDGRTALEFHPRIEDANFTRMA